MSLSKTETKPVNLKEEYTAKLALCEKFIAHIKEEIQKSKAQPQKVELLNTHLNNEITRRLCFTHFIEDLKRIEA